MLLFQVRLALGLKRLPSRRSLGGVELRVLRWKHTSRVLEPSVKLRTQHLDTVELDVCQVRLLARIDGQLI